MADTSQKRALRNYRSRLTERGMARFEVLGLDADRELVRRLAEDGPEAAQVRETVSRTIAGERPSKGGILRALRRSPLLGAVFDIAGIRQRRPQGQSTRPCPWRVSRGRYR